MSISFDAGSNINVSASATSFTVAHTCTGTNLILFVGIVVYDSPYDCITGVTYNGTSMTFIDKAFLTGDRGGPLYYLVAPSTGTHNIVISSSSSVRIGMSGMSFTGAAQTSPIDSEIAQQFGSSSTYTQTLTVGTANSFLVSTVYSGRVLTGGTNTTVSGFNSNQTGLYSTSSVGTGSQSLTATLSGSASQAAVMAAFKPFVSSTVNSNFLSFMTQ